MNFKEEQENGKFRLIARFSDFEQKILKNDLLGLDGIVTWVDNNVKQKFSVLSIKTAEEDGNLKIEWSISPADKIDAELKSIEEITKNKLENCKVRMFSAWGRDIWERYKKNFDKDDEEYVALITSQKDYKDREAREEELNNQSKKHMECIQEIQRNFPAQSAFE
ncbi:MAG: hypothetical protein Q7U02_03065, partial [Desulfosalsimonadaceae bacterium]|nr:hypothetical protein [Desulfosalsimonadaceae bacterium]